MVVFFALARIRTIMTPDKTRGSRCSSINADPSEGKRRKYPLCVLDSRDTAHPSSVAEWHYTSSNSLISKHWYPLGKGMPTSAPVRLLLGRLVEHGLLRAAAVAGVGVRHFGIGRELHGLFGFFVRTSLEMAVGIRGSRCLPTLGGGLALGGHGRRRRCLALLGGGRGDEITLDEPSLDTDAPVGQGLATTVPDLLLPIAPRPLRLEPGDDGRPLGGGIDPNPSVLVVDLSC